MAPLKMQNGVGRLSYSKCQSLLFILITVVASTHAVGNFSYLKCSQACNCSIIYSKKILVLTVECCKGDMNRIPTKDMENNITRLIIIAPKNRPNNLIIGPVFRNLLIFGQLKELVLVNSNIPSIGIHSFWGLEKLRLLDLHFNNIISISEENFIGLKNLTDLNLSHNHIKNMASKTFQHCGLLKKLNLGYNNITVLVPRLFKKLEKLKDLDLSVNPLEELTSEAFIDIPQLTIFKCRNCKLSRINPHINHMVPNLKELDLGYNQIKYILKDDFPSLKNLSKLKIDGNQISVIVDNVFGQNQMLKELNLAHNKLALLSPNSLTNLTNLTILDMGYNRIESFDLGTFLPVIRSLAKIVFSGNKIPLREIAVLLQILPDIKHVSLANLSVSELPPNFLNFNQNLTSLNLSWNRLTRFPLEVLSKTNYLQELDISFNHLSSLQEPELKRLEAIPFVHLLNNRWICNQCSVGMMLAYMNTTVLNQTLRDQRCYEPIQLRGYPLAKIRLEMLDVCQPLHGALVSVVVALVLVLVSALAIVTAALCFTRRRAQQRYYTQEQKRRERNHEHPEELLPHTELGSLPTIHSPFRGPCEHS